MTSTQAIVYDCALLIVWRDKQINVGRASWCKHTLVRDREISERTTSTQMCSRSIERFPLFCSAINITCGRRINESVFFDCAFFLGIIAAVHYYNVPIFVLRTTADSAGADAVFCNTLWYGIRFILFFKIQVLPWHFANHNKIKLT